MTEEKNGTFSSHIYLSGERNRFGSKRALIRLQIRLKEEKPRIRSCERPNSKEKQMWHYWKGRRTLPKTHAGLGVERKSPEVVEKAVQRAGRDKKTQKNALAGLERDKHRWRVARRRQARLEVEAREVQVVGEETHVAENLSLVLRQNLKISSLRT